jgi:hypothetical protein
VGFEGSLTLGPVHFKLGPAALALVALAGGVIWLIGFLHVLTVLGRSAALSLVAEVRHQLQEFIAVAVLWRREARAWKECFVRDRHSAQPPESLPPRAEASTQFHPWQNGPSRS